MSQEDEQGQRLGIVVSGSLNKGVEVKLDSSASVEDMVVGRYVTIEGNKRRFFGMITDVSLGVTDQELTLAPPDVSDPFIAEVLAGTTTYGTLHVSPQRTIGGDAASLLEGPQPVKTVPSHFSVVNLASDRDIELVFGKEDKERFWIGNPLDMETKLCLNLAELVKRSNGIFGKSGTGKTFLTRILLIGMLQKSAAVNLVFDMHSEYGWEGSSEQGRKVKALKQLFPSKVAVFTLDEESSRRRKVSTDFVVRIGYDEIEPEDISLLRQTLNLTDLAVEAAYQLFRIFGRDWLQSTLNLKGAEELPGDSKIHESTLQNLQRGLNTIKRLSFIEPQAPTKAVQHILEYLDRGINVVLDFNLMVAIILPIAVAIGIWISYCVISKRTTIFRRNMGIAASGGLMGAFLAAFLPFWIVFILLIAIALFDMYSVKYGPIKKILDLEGQGINNIPKKKIEKRVIYRTLSASTSNSPSVETQNRDKSTKELSTNHSGEHNLPANNSSNDEEFDLILMYDNPNWSLGLGDFVIYSMFTSAVLTYCLLYLPYYIFYSPPVGLILPWVIFGICALGLLLGFFITLRLLQKYDYLPGLPITVACGFLVFIICIIILQIINYLLFNEFAIII